MSVATKFGLEIEEARLALSGVSEAEACRPVRPGGWLRKEELGHLLDSVQNNHQRIVLAALHGAYNGPEYAQNDWVALHAYDSMDWSELLALWANRSRLLHRVIARIPQARLAAPVTIGAGPTMPLSDWIDDYLQHMAHHVARITGSLQ